MRNSEHRTADEQAANGKQMLVDSFAESGARAGASDPTTQQTKNDAGDSNIR